ncbi:MAG: hypothetical protein NT036_02425 [Candidatus Omnitrophica bacterium]|nr:hypothetical protein [Candidatus Omnitrophota bacterium]
MRVKKMGHKVLLLATLLLVPSMALGIGGGMEGDSGSVPKVIYTKPADGSALDLTGKERIVFEWQMVPIPSGNRETYKFVLFKGDGYQEVSSQMIDARTFRAEVPSDKFEPDARYRWYVKQRDAKTLVWSQYDSWYFKVTKR